MYEVQQHNYNVEKDDFEPVGVKVPFLTLSQAKKSAKEAHKETEEYYLITKVADETFKLWHDDV